MWTYLGNTKIYYFKTYRALTILFTIKENKQLIIDRFKILRGVLLYLNLIIQRVNVLIKNCCGPFVKSDFAEASFVTVQCFLQSI